MKAEFESLKRLYIDRIKCQPLFWKVLIILPSQIETSKASLRRLHGQFKRLTYFYATIYFFFLQHILANI